MFSIKPLTFFVYKMNITPIEESLRCLLLYPRLVSTSMKKVVGLLVKTPKNLYGKEKNTFVG
jgi:hypothetical protein